MKNLSKKLLGPVQILLLAIIIGVSANYIYAAGSYEEPGCVPTPPIPCNASAPINVSSIGQIKDGGLTVGADPTVTNGLLVKNGNVGIGNSSPTSKLSFGSSLLDSTKKLALYENSTGGDLYGFGITSGSLNIFAGGASRMAVKNSGLVTIGPASPLQNTVALDVSGSIQLTGGDQLMASRDNMALQAWQDGAGDSNSGLYLNPFKNVTVFVGGDQNGGSGSPNPNNALLYVHGRVSAYAFFYNSDRSLKENIKPISDALGKILQLQGVSFNWKGTGKQSVGVIAQDVEKVFPELVGTDASNGLKTVEYGNLVAPLIEAVKEQQKQIDELKAQIKEIQAKK